MNIREHENFLRQMHEGKDALLAQVQAKIEEIGAVKAGNLTGKTKQYMSNIKNGSKYISYETLINIAKILLKDN